MRFLGKAGVRAMDKCEGCGSAAAWVSDCGGGITVWCDACRVVAEDEADAGGQAAWPFRPLLPCADCHAQGFDVCSAECAQN